MTPRAFRWLAAALLVALAAGACLALRAAVPKAPQTLACSEWLARPRAGHFRLNDCVLDTVYSRAVVAPQGQPRARMRGEPRPSVRPPRPVRAFVEVVRRDEGPRLFALTEDPAMLARAERLARDRQPEERVRTIERYASELRVGRSIEGTIVAASDWGEPSFGLVTEYPHRFAAERDFVMEEGSEGRSDPRLGLVGGALVVVLGPSTLLFFLWQRRWRRRAEELTGVRPRAF